MLDLDRDQIAAFTKFKNRFIIRKAANFQFCQSTAWRIPIRIEYRKVDVPIDSRLDQHPPQLSASNYSEFEILIKMIRHLLLDRHPTGVAR